MKESSVEVTKMKKKKKVQKKMSNKQKRQLYGFGLPIILGTILLLGVSYAWLQLTLHGTVTNTLEGGKLSLKLDDTKSLGITDEEALPKLDEVGLMQDPYTFTLTNEGNVESKYTIFLDDVPLLQGEEQLPNTSIKYNLTRNESDLGTKLLSSTVKNNKRVLDTGIIDPGGNYVYNLKMWIDEHVKSTDSGKIFKGIIHVVADQIPEPNSFASDDWLTIMGNVRTGNTSKYNVGDTREIEMTGEFGKQVLRIANKETPEDCKQTNFSETACGFVVEFVDIIETRQMNQNNTNVGGYPASAMHQYLEETIFKALPEELQNVIIDTRVISGQEKDQPDNYTSNDKLYLLSPREIWNNNDDSLGSKTRQLDYYSTVGVTTSAYDLAIKKFKTEATGWWLRSATNTNRSGFKYVVATGGPWNYYDAIASLGVSPAFRIG